MYFTDTRIAGAWIIDPSPHYDERGRFMRTWCVNEFEQRRIHFMPVQANMQFSSRKGTVRGLHLQVAPAPEAKLVRCTRGAIFDVVVDLRPVSPTFGKWLGLELRADGGRAVYVPTGCAHGFLVLEDDTEVEYLISAVYAPDHARGIRWDDPAIAIEWPFVPTIVSERDRSFENIDLDALRASGLEALR